MVTRKKYKGLKSVILILAVLILSIGSVCLLKGEVYALVGIEEDDMEYATVTYAIAGAVGDKNDPNHKHTYTTTTLSGKGKNGKISSKNGTILAWLYNNETDKTPVWKCKVAFDSNGNWTYYRWGLDENGDIATREPVLKGNGKFDLQQIFEKNCDFKNGKKNTAYQNRYLAMRFSKGTYDITNFFRVYSNTKIYGELEAGKDTSGEIIFNKKNSSVVFLTFDDRSAATKGYTGFKNITLKNFTVNCKNGETYYGSGLMNAAHGEKLIVDNVTVKDGLAGHSIKIV